MKTYDHSPSGTIVKLCRLPPSASLAEEYRPYLGEEYTVIEVIDCSLKQAYGEEGGCVGSRTAFKCLGRMRLDRAPFDGEPRCWGWGDFYLFDFVE